MLSLKLINFAPRNIVRKITQKMSVVLSDFSSGWYTSSMSLHYACKVSLILAHGVLRYRYRINTRTETKTDNCQTLILINFRKNDWPQSIYYLEVGTRLKNMYFWCIDTFRICQRSHRWTIKQALHSTLTRLCPTCCYNTFVAKRGKQRNISLHVL